MGGLRIIYEGAIIGTGSHLLAGLAFDGRYLYSSAPAEKMIYKLDENGSILQKFHTTRSFVGLCYDGVNRCFWAITRESPLYVFRLTQRFDEFDRLRITGPVAAQPRAIDIDLKQGCLLVAAGEHLLHLSLSGEVTQTLQVPFATKDISCFGDYRILGGTGVDIHNQHMGFIEGFSLPTNLQVTGVSMLYHLPDRMVCTVLCTRNHRYNCLLQTIIEPERPLEQLTKDNAYNTALVGPSCADCPVQGSVSVGLAALSGVLEQLLNALLHYTGDGRSDQQ